MAIMCASLIGQLQAQEPNTKMGKPTKEELTMTTYAPDPNASAVVLYKSTRVWYDILGGDFKVYTEVNTRIKVLKPEGKEYADVEVPYVENESMKSSHEDITGLKACAFNMENGKMVKTKMEGSSVVRERVDKNNMLLKFSVPQVKEGTVIEYQYVKQSDFYFYIDTWVAQTDIPVAYTIYSLLIPEYFRFSIDESGIVKTEKKVEDENIRLLGPGGQSIDCQASRYQFVGRNLPAIKSDSYVFCPLDYCKKVRAELSGLEVPGSLYKSFSYTWQQVGKGLYEDDDFGGRIKRSCPIKDLVPSSGAAEEKDVLGKMATIYVALKKRLKWNGEYRLYGRAASKVLKDGTGSNADLNFILLSAYREAGLDARPVVMSRRTRGRLPVTHPSAKQLNTFVVGVVDGQTVHFIDASVEDGYVDVLPPLLLTDQGYLLAEDGNGTWLNLQTLDASKASVNIDATMDASGKMEGKYMAQRRANLSASLKEDFRTADDSVTFVNKIAERNGITISAYSIDSREAFLPMLTEHISFSKQCEADEDHIYFSPFLFPPMKESPFKDVERVLPVEYPYKHSLNMACKIQIPQGYTIEEMPKPIRLSTDGNGLSVRVNYVAQGCDLIVQFRFSVNKTLFLPTEYGALRQIYDTMVEKCGEMVVLKKN